MIEKKLGTASRSRSIAFCGLIIALLTVSAWVSIPIGAVPITLQVFVLVFALIVLTPKEFFASFGGYLVLGAVGLPVFSSMRGGIGVLAGPTGGFLWGFVLGAIAAYLIMGLIHKRDEALAQSAQSVSGQGADTLTNRKTTASREFVAYYIAAFVFLIIGYLCGLVQLMALTGMDVVAAFFVAIAPFIIFDCIKIVLAVTIAHVVKKALR